ncbi:CTD small phosphatase-like protein 3 isoform X2 [Ananas comosus]|nr:CTD small phosphatase-like protein 3 isoform X2 [Ananas comosus]
MATQSSIDVICTETMGPTSATCSANLETIFSPNYEHIDSHLRAIYDINEVRYEKPDLPHLIAEDSDEGSCATGDYQSCSFSNFYIPEDTSSLSFDSLMGFTNRIDTADNEHTDSDMVIDMAERYVILPFLEKTVETNNIDDEVSDDTCLYLAIHQVKPNDEETQRNCGSGDWEGNESYNQHVYMGDLPALPGVNSTSCPTCLPKSQERKKHITLVLDLDETLVHSTLEHCDDADFTFPVFFDMKEHTVYVKQRPYLKVFLERVAEMFEIVVFTASQSIYAEKLLDILDPERKLISQRIYRESCIFSDGSYTKDLTILGVELAKVAIIDNSPQVFRLQVNNGIPIKSWFDDRTDHALLQLLPFLETLVDAEDVRPIIAEKFGNKE